MTAPDWYDDDDLLDECNDDLEPAFCDHFCADDICRNMGECAWRDPDDDEKIEDFIPDERRFPAVPQDPNAPLPEPTQGDTQ